MAWSFCGECPARRSDPHARAQGQQEDRLRKSRGVLGKIPHRNEELDLAYLRSGIADFGPPSLSGAAEIQGQTGQG